MSPMCMGSWKIQSEKQEVAQLNSVVGKHVFIHECQMEGIIEAVSNGLYKVKDIEYGFDWKIKPNEADFISHNPIEYQRISASAWMNKKDKDPKTIHKTDTIRNSIEIDLHKDAIGKTGWQKLQNQLYVFKHTLEEHKGKHGVKITFINGNGVEDCLRNEMIKILNLQKKAFTYQDAQGSNYRYHTALKVVVL